MILPNLLEELVNVTNGDTLFRTTSVCSGPSKVKARRGDLRMWRLCRLPSMLSDVI